MSEELNDFKFPVVATTDDLELLEPDKKYKFAIGKIFPLFRDSNAKVCTPDHPEAQLDSVGLELWCTEKVVSTPEGNFEFNGQARFVEYFPMVANKHFEKTKWKSKAFFHCFEGIVSGEKGNKTVNFEKVKDFYGHKISLTFKKNTYGLNIDYSSIVMLEGEKIVPKKILESVEVSYKELIKKVQDEKNSSKPNSPVNLEDVPF